MAIKSMKLKLKTKSGSNALSIRKGLWKTHEMMNAGIAYYMEWLTLLRQESIGLRSKEELRLELILRLKRQQQQNGYVGDSSNIPEEVFTVLRELYECIVPSSVRQSGDAQVLSRKYLSPLVDPKSKGGEGESKAGRKPGWLLKQEAGDPSWEQDYEKAKKRKESDPTARLMQKLREYGLKPLFPLFTNEQKEIQWLPLKENQYVRTWDRDMFQQAIERLLSWESWNLRLKDERDELLQKAVRFEQNYLIDADEWMEPLKQYELARAKELAQVAEAPVTDFMITKRQIRGWKQLSEKWGKLDKNASEEDFIAIIAEVQSSMPKEFGDPILFRFLARPENHWIWRDHQDRLFLFQTYNELKRRLAQVKEQATFTLPDPVNHPLWIRFDARGGNLHDYDLWQESRKSRSRQTVTFSSLIMPSDQGWEEQADVEVEIALSKQFYRQVRIQDHTKGKQEIIFYDYSVHSGKPANIPLHGYLGGAKIQFDRKHLEKNRDKVALGEIGSVFLNVTVDIEPFQPLKNGRLQTPLGQVLKVLPKEWPKVIEYKPSELENWWKETLDAQILSTEQKKGIESLSAGMRIMTVDMGIRSSAAVSIFEIATERPTDSSKLCFRLPDNDLYAVHCRSLLVNLPGEKPDKRIREARELRTNQRYGVRQLIRMLSNIQRLHSRETEAERLKAVTDLEQALWQNENVTQVERDQLIPVLRELLQRVTADPDVWTEQIEKTYRELERLVGAALTKWKKSFGPGRRNLAGLSMWNIEELESLRRMLISWSKRSRRPQEKNHLQEKEQFAQGLLTHIQEVKDNRLKQMTNLIVMTALGYKYVDKHAKWVASYPACQIILFEDLSRYRMKQDRSRMENSLLMKWAHRSIPRHTWMQGEPFGLQVGDVRSEFSSRFHARTGAPGIRCHVVTEKDINNPLFKDQLLRKNFLKEEQFQYLQPGDIVPMQGGELFVTLSGPNSQDVILIHADINAAQNLQRRFWTRNQEIFRIVCQAVEYEGNVAFVPKYEKRLGKGLLVKRFADEQVYKWDAQAKLKSKKALPDDSYESEDGEEYFEGLEEAKEVRGEYKTLFRDPSGTFFPSDTWRPQVEFWGIVKARLEKLLREKILTGR